jgi:hypothetical protein
LLSNIFNFVITPFYQNIRAERSYQFQRRIFAEYNNSIHYGERRNQQGHGFFSFTGRLFPFNFRMESSALCYDQHICVLGRFR